MSKTRSIVISLATALVALGLSAPAPVYPQTAPVQLKATYFSGSGSTQAGVTVGDPVLLTASALNNQAFFASKVEIQGRRVQPFWSVLQTCHALPCQVRVVSRTAGTFRFRAVLTQGGTDIPSREITVVWAFTMPTTLIVDMEGRHVEVEYTFTGTKFNQTRRTWRPVPGATGPMAAPPGTNWTDPLKGNASITAKMNTRLPNPWEIFISRDIATDPRCTDSLQCTAAFLHGTGNGSAGVYLCRNGRGPNAGRVNVDCNSGSDPEVAINIRWAP